MRNRFVKAMRHRKPGDGSPGSTYYKPVELRNGNLYELCNQEDFDHALGFEDVSDAWRVIDTIEMREYQEEIEEIGRDNGRRGRRDSGREDFHSDG